MEKTFGYDQRREITDLLMGRKVTKVSDDTLELDNGLVLKLVGNSGSCCCGSGKYDLTELNGTDNVITKVKFDHKPSGDSLPDRGGPGHYTIFVYADNKKVNLATFEGDDGNGYYGTGYEIVVSMKEPQKATEPATGGGEDEVALPISVTVGGPYVLVELPLSLMKDDGSFKTRVFSGYGITHRHEVVVALMQALVDIGGVEVPDEYVRYILASVEANGDNNVTVDSVGKES